MDCFWSKINLYIFGYWPLIGILVSPGKSRNPIEFKEEEISLVIMGSSQISFWFPASLVVLLTILY
jgi:hypothetical protein